MNFEARISLALTDFPAVKAFAEATQGPAQWKPYQGLHGCYLYCEGTSYSSIESKFKSAMSALTFLGLQAWHGKISLVMFDTYSESGKILVTEPVEVVTPTN